MSWLEKTINRAERTTRAMQSGGRRARRGYNEVRRIYNRPGNGIRGLPRRR